MLEVNFHFRIVSRWVLGTYDALDCTLSAQAHCVGSSMYRLEDVSQCSQHLLPHLVQLNGCCIYAVTCVT